MCNREIHQITEYYSIAQIRPINANIENHILRLVVDMEMKHRIGEVGDGLLATSRCLAGHSHMLHDCSGCSAEWA